MDLGWPSLLILISMHFLEYTVQNNADNTRKTEDSVILSNLCYAIKKMTIFMIDFHASEMGGKMGKGFTVYFTSGIVLNQ